MKKTILFLLCLLVFLSGCAKDTPVETAAAPETTIPAATAAPETTETAPPPSTEPPEERFILTFAGDATLGCNTHHMYAGFGFIKTVGEDYAYPFANVIDYFAEDEFSMVNLEGPLADGGNPQPKKHAFRGPTAFVQILTQNSVEAVSLGNNHTLDYGESAYATTLSTLEEAGISYVERDASTMVTTKNGLKIGLYAMTYYLLDVQDMVSEITALREQGADIVIVAPHWGVEMTYRPTREQIDVGHAAIDAGADIVFGTHPHVLQPVEHYGNGMIYYSLGNFVFGGNIYPKDYDAAVLQQEVIRSADGSVRLGELTMVPINVSSMEGRNNYQPTPYAPGSEEYDRAIAKLEGTFDGPNLPVN